MIDPQIALAAAMFLGALLMAAAIHKLLDPGRFQTAIASYRLVPTQLASAAGILIPLVEAGLGLSLFWSVTREMAAAGAMVLFLGYGLAMGFTVIGGTALADCGCSFTARPATSPWFPVLRNAGLCMICALAFLPGVSRPTTALDIVQALLAAGSLALLYMAAEALGSARQWEKAR